MSEGKFDGHVLSVDGLIAKLTELREVVGGDAPALVWIDDGCYVPANPQAFTVDFIEEWEAFDSAAPDAGIPAVKL